jgi:hypothetical protein
MTDVVGTAKVIATQSTIVPRIDGDVLTDTRAAQADGTNGSPMPIEALDAVREQVQRLMTKLLRAYEDEVAVGEIGPSGCAIASDAPPRQRCPTGLLYGRVQSGKTLAMITATAMALDNGFRVIVVLTSDNVSLVKQTADRFRALRGVNVKDSTDIGSWLDDKEHLRTTIGEGGLVLVLAKNSSHLDRFIEFLRTVGAPQYPALILDDEADQASLDTNTAKRATALRKGKTTEVVATAINRKTNVNLDPKEKGNSIREVLRHHVYLQVTATSSVVRGTPRAWFRLHGRRLLFQQGGRRQRCSAERHGCRERVARRGRDAGRAARLAVVLPCRCSRAGARRSQVPLERAELPLPLEPQQDGPRRGGRPRALVPSAREGDARQQQPNVRGHDCRRTRPEGAVTHRLSAAR